MNISFTSHNRPQEVLESILRNDSSLTVQDRADKYAKMSASPYGFFRGSNHLYWLDFFRDWHLSLYGGIPETQTWIQGDAHIYNFGAFGNENGDIVYGMDDFDDSIVADYQYDLWRLAISIVLDCRDNGNFSTKKIARAVRKLGKAYLKEVSSYNGNISSADAPTAPLRSFLQTVKEKKDRKELLEKWTILLDGNRIFRTEREKLQTMEAEEQENLAQALQKHLHNFDHPDEPARRHFKIKDAAFRLKAGTGSLGTLRIYALIEGSDSSTGDDVILDIKEQTLPEACKQMSEKELKQYRRAFPDEGLRHARAFRAISRRPDRYLGWMHWDGRDFSIRERSPFKEDFPTRDTKRAKDYRKMAKQWGGLLARGHLRGASDLGPTRATDFASYMKAIKKKRKSRFLDFLESIATGYADCVEQDFQTFQKAIGGLVEGTLTTDH
ncbi:MAG TPA: hypothetical protein DEA96_13655 [Leptospiraceae bacterium]|nr:hypothetical protein [Spirochaetaceae bacterium]HBS06007.1 hypothetical protein [Leptospiraceae bacterium]|tara:strand:+ start:34637 stop:35956 length:1320 start_codon:yes stop_codon:yes gene_type:complete